MFKNFTKELIIVLLITLAIILVLGVFLYEYMPNNKVIPEEITYTTSSTVKEALQNAPGVNEEDVIRTYTLDQTDLDYYQLANDYRPGKTNPFSTYVTQSGDNEGSGNENGESGNGSTGGTTNAGGSSGNNGAGNGTSGNTGDKTKPIAPGQVNPGNYTNDKGLK